MNKFNKIGFLAEVDEFFKKLLWEKCSEELELCTDFNQVAQKLQYEISINNTSAKEIISASLFARVLQSYQAALLVAFKGMNYQVEVSIRCFLEPLFPLVAISRNRDFHIKILEASEIDRKKVFGKLINYKTRNKQYDEELERFKKLKSEIESNIKENNLKSLSVYDCAKHAGLLDFYETLYSCTSTTLHSKVASLEEHLVLDVKNKKILALKNEPEINGLNDSLVTLANCMGLAIQSVCEIFKLTEPNEIKDLANRLRDFRKYDA
ncbi:DUF5677 domain-containing protein [Endozoicomonas sp. ALB032]|uniref:DUF5677 domain-containing protein n=1 Tax=Endozoicomonas sp. ALB032 TaxID=3403082 RepID=UPI003BB57905